MSPSPPLPPSGRSTNPFDADDDDDSDFDDETISRMLDNMDIDADFNCWTSFRASMSIKSKNSFSLPSSQHRGGGGTATSQSGAFDVIGEQKDEEPLTKSERAYVDKWSRRLDREEVYSRTYRPVPREEREVKDLAAFLGVVSGGGGTAKQLGSAGGLLDKMNMGNLRHENANHNNNASERIAVEKLLFPLPNEEKSVLLKRGPVLMRQWGQVDYEERELILLSHGLILATPLSADEVPGAVAEESSPSSQQKKSERKIPSALTKIPSGLVNGLSKIPSGRGKKVIHRHFESAMLLSSIRLEDVVNETNSFAILVVFVNEGTSLASPETRLIFTCAKLPQKEAWVSALEKVLHFTKFNSDDHTVDGRVANSDAIGGGMSANALSRNMAALQERGDRLEKLDNKAADLDRNAADYRETARQLKEKAKKQTVFGL